MIANTRLAILGALTFLCLGSATARESGRTIEIHAHRYAFTPSEITMKKGETVTLKLYSDDVPHSLLIKGLGINQTIAKGKPVEVTFTASRTGDFPGQCGRFCGSGHGKMTIAVHVTGD